MPTLLRYPRIEKVMDRFAFTEVILMLFVFLATWLFYLQWERQKFSVIYSYLVYSVYLFLLFVVLFTKAKKYHAVSWNPIDFLQLERVHLSEAFLNVVYFIPLGILYGMKARVKEFFVIALLTIIGIETIQYVFYLGTFALSDIFLNLLGCWIGFQIWPLIKQRMADVDN
ncbi:hypothetical protein RU97_GL001937 [Enterococcus canis]|uniref:VanZ-like domain-containing protein n=2 Tax=Enterococcus canis TaxID=214095 RepID=A0A1L8RFJ0_9ENTE|nr:VanZ family protein [Enterococcus canis]OJG18540.1 hypothetical protein RU97_GL001937 [Enterococcus canis]